MPKTQAEFLCSFSINILWTKNEPGLLSLGKAMTCEVNYYLYYFNCIIFTEYSFIHYIRLDYEITYI